MSTLHFRMPKQTGFTKLNQNILWNFFQKFLKAWGRHEVTPLVEELFWQLIATGRGGVSCFVFMFGF